MTKEVLATIEDDANVTVISEMSNEAVSGLIELDKSLVDSIVGDDPDPMFVTLEVLNEGVSRNGRYYDLNALKEVSEQINSEHPDGYAGHITQEERSNKVPDAEVIWLGSKLMFADGKNRLFAKGYVLPEAKKRRSYLEKAKAIGKNVSVSIYGTAKQVWDKSLKAYKQMKINLESIDFTRPKSEGVPNAGMFALTSEMVDEESKLNEKPMEKAEVLKSCSKDDIVENVPEEVIKEITDEAVAKALSDKEAVISEMTAEKDKIIAEMRAENRNFQLSSLLNTKVRDSKARRMVERMVISEMADDEPVEEAVDRVLESEEGKAVVAEMTTVEPNVMPRIDQKSAAKAERRYTKRKY